MREFERLKTREDEFQPHPKIEKLKALVLQHFANAQNEEPEEDGSTETRAMVFAQYRDAVDEIVEELNKEQPMIRAERFVGQGLDKAGKKVYAAGGEIPPPGLDRKGGIRRGGAAVPEGNFYGERKRHRVSS